MVYSSGEPSLAHLCCSVRVGWRREAEETKERTESACKLKSRKGETVEWSNSSHQLSMLPRIHLRALLQVDLGSELI